MRQVLKWIVPISGGDVEVGAGEVVHVEEVKYHTGAGTNEVGVWTVEERPDHDTPVRKVRARIYATGQELDEGVEIVGSVVTKGAFVWHVGRERASSRGVR